MANIWSSLHYSKGRMFPALRLAKEQEEVRPGPSRRSKEGLKGNSGIRRGIPAEIFARRKQKILTWRLVLSAWSSLRDVFVSIHGDPKLLDYPGITAQDDIRSSSRFYEPGLVHSVHLSSFLLYQFLCFRLLVFFFHWHGCTLALLFCDKSRSRTDGNASLAPKTCSSAWMV